MASVDTYADSIEFTNESSDILESLLQTRQEDVIHERDLD